MGRSDMIEKAVVFGPDRSLVGVWAEPAEPVDADARVAVVMVNSGIIHHAGMWRLHVRMARALTEIGIASFRFDLSGVGDSGYGQKAGSLNESVLRDMDDAIDYVSETRGWSKVVMAGLCSGAVDSLQAANRRDEVVGAVAIDLLADFRTWRHHAVHYGTRLRRWESWKSTFLLRNGAITRAARAAMGGMSSETGHDPDRSSFDGGRRPMTREEVVESLSALLGRDGRALCAFSAGLEENYNHRGQFAGVFPDLAADSRITVDFFPDADHTFSDRAQQRALVRRITTWVCQLRDATVPTP